MDESHSNEKAQSCFCCNRSRIPEHLNKWLIPNLGDLPLSAVDNKAGKELVAKLYAANLAPKTIVEIVGAMKEVIASAIDTDGR